MKLAAGKAEGFAQFVRSIQTARSFWLAFGIVLTYAGLETMQELTPVLKNQSYLAFAYDLNQSLHLDIVNFPNVFLGFLAILTGALIVVKSIPAAQPGGDAPSFHEWSQPAAMDWTYAGPRLVGALTLFGLLLLQLANHSYSGVSLLFWLVSILVISLLFWKHERNLGINLHLNADWRDGAWMLLLFAFALGSGAYLLNEIPTYLIPDEGSFWETARSIAIGTYKPAFFDFGVYSFPVASSIFQGWVMRFAGINLWGWRFSSVFAASLTVFPLYLLAKEWFDRRVAVIACILLATSPYYLSFARLGYNNSQALAPVTLAIFFLVLAIRRGSYFHLWLSGLAAGLGYYTYFSAWLGIVVALVVLAYLPLTAGIKFRKALSLVLIVVAGWLIVAAPRIVYGASGDLDTSFYYKVAETSFVSGFYGRATFGETAINEAVTWKVGNAEAFFDLRYYGIFFLRGIIRSISALFIPDLYHDHFIVTELAGRERSLFFVIGLGLALTSLRSAHRTGLNAWFWLGLLFLSILGAFPPRPTHMVAMIPVIALLTAFGLTTTIEAVVETIPLEQQKRQQWGLRGTGLTLVILAVAGLAAYFVRVPINSHADFDRTASWLARRIPNSTTIVFIEPTAVPHDAAYQSQTGLTTHQIVSVTPADIPGLPGAIKEREFMFFVSAENNTDGMTLDALSNTFPKTLTHTIVNPVGGTLGYLVTNIPVEMTRRIEFAEGLRGLWTSPARTIILLSLLASLVMAFIARAGQPLTIGVESPRSRTAGYQIRTRWPVIDIDFRIRIQLPPRDDHNSAPPKGPDPDVRG